VANYSFYFYVRDKNSPLTIQISTKWLIICVKVYVTFYCYTMAVRDFADIYTLTLRPASLGSGVYVNKITMAWWYK